MFDCLEVSLKVLERLAPIEVAIRRKSNELAKQITRAAESVSLNLAEGQARRDGDQRRHYEMAAGSASELTAGLRIARLRSYIDDADYASVDEVLDRVRAMLYRLTH
jgi:four helix bundle protein